MAAVIYKEAVFVNCFLFTHYIRAKIAVICVCKRKYQCYMQRISHNVFI